MNNFSDILLANDRRDSLVGALVELIEGQVASRKGLKGATLKAGLAVLKSAKPGILPRAVNRLLPDFAEALDPLYQEYMDGGHSIDFAAFLQQRSDRATEALLGVADLRVRQASGSVQSAYKRLRGSAEAEVATAMPGIAQLLAQRLDATV